MLTRVAQYIRRCLPATISKKHIAVFLILFVSLSIALFAVDVRLVHAQTMLDSVASGILNVLTKVALFFARLCMAMAIFFLRFFIQLGAYNGFLDAPIVRLGWVMLRDIANMFFVVALLVIAFATILGRESYEWKKAMVKLVLVAIVVNFSLLICGVVLDAAHVFTVTFINAIAPVAAGNLITMFNFDSMQSIVTNTGGGQAGDFDLALFGGAAMALFFSALAALTIGAYCVILLYRMVAIWSLLIFSPLAFVLSVLPATENYFEEWKSEFTKNVLSAPIAVFFLWLAFATMGANSPVEHLNQYSSGFEIQDVSGEANGAGDSVVGGIGAEQTGTNSVSINAASTWAAMAGFLVAMAFLLKGIEQVQSLGVHGSGWLDSAQSFAKNVATIGSGVALGGWLLGKGRDFSVNSAKNLGLSVGTQTGIIPAWKSFFTGKGAFAANAQAAEGRLHLLEQQKEKEEAKNRALGVQGKGGVTFFGLGKGAFAGIEKAHLSLAEQSVLADHEEHNAHGKEEETRAQTELAMLQGEYDGKKGFENISKRMDKAAHHELSIKMDQDRLDTFKKKQTAEHRQHLADQEHGDAKYKELQKEKAQAETAEGLAEAAESLVTASAKLKEVGKEEFKKLKLEQLRAETREHDASKVEKEVGIDVKRKVYTTDLDEDLKHELEHAREHEIDIELQERALKGYEKDQSQQQRKKMRQEQQVQWQVAMARRLGVDGSTVDAVQDAMNELEHAETDTERSAAETKLSTVREALVLANEDKRKKMSSLFDRRQLDEQLAREGFTDSHGHEKRFSMADALLQEIRVSESASDAEWAEKGWTGDFNMEYIASERVEREQRMNRVRAKLQADKLKKLWIEKEGGNADRQLSSFRSNDVGLEYAFIAAAQRLGGKMTVNDVKRKVKSGDNDVSDLVDAELIRFGELSAGTTDQLIRTMAADELEIDVSTIDINNKDHRVALLNSVLRQAKNTTGQELDTAALKSLTQQDYALEYKKAGVLRGLGKLDGAEYVAEEERKFKKSQSEELRIAEEVRDEVLRTEGKLSELRVNALMKKAREYVSDFAHIETYEQADEALREYYATLSRLNQKRERGQAFTEADDKLFENTTQSMRKLQATLASKFMTSLPALYASVDAGIKGSGIALNTEETIPLVDLAMATGQKVTDFIELDEDGQAVRGADGKLVLLRHKMRQAQDIIKKGCKEKYDAMQYAQMLAINTAATTRKAMQYYGTYIESLDEFGNKIITQAIQAENGPLRAGAISTGTAKNGLGVRQGQAANNIGKSISAAGVTEARPYLALAYLSDDSIRAVDFAGEQERQLLMSLMQRNVSTQINDAANIRWIFGDGFGGGEHGGALSLLKEGGKEEKKAVFASEKQMENTYGLWREKMQALNQAVSQAAYTTHLQDIKQILIAIHGQKTKVNGKEITLTSATPEELSSVVNAMYTDATWDGATEGTKKTAVGGDKDFDFTKSRFAKSESSNGTSATVNSTSQSDSTDLDDGSGGGDGLGG